MKRAALKLGGVIRRDDEPEVMAIAVASLGEAAGISVFTREVEQPSGRSVAGHSLAAKIGEMGRERRGLRARGCLKLCVSWFL